MAEKFSKTFCSAFASLKRTISLEVKSVVKCFSFSSAWNTRTSYQTQLKWWTLTNHFLLCFNSLPLPMTFSVNDKKKGKRDLEIMKFYVQVTLIQIYVEFIMLSHSFIWLYSLTCVDSSFLSIGDWCISKNRQKDMQL